MLALRSRVPYLHVHAPCEKVGRPGGADGAGTDDGDALYIAGLRKRHGSLLCWWRALGDGASRSSIYRVPRALARAWLIVQAIEEIAQ